jgi:hypothetical protein
MEDRNIKVSLKDIADLEKRLEEVYPCTVVLDRYGGTYSGAKWLAFDGNPADIPMPLSVDGGSDTEQMEFWGVVLDDDDYMSETYNMEIGFGNTPNEAVLDLEYKVSGKQTEDDRKEAEIKYYEVWSEGYAATGERAGALCHTTLEDGRPCKTRARSFIEACKLTLGDRLDIGHDDELELSKQLILTQDGLIHVPMVWGCRLFDNEQRARNSFG